MSKPSVQEAREVLGVRRILESEVVRLFVARATAADYLALENDPHCSSDEHSDFLQLCRSGDVEAAVASMTEHLTRIEANLQLTNGAPDRQPDQRMDSNGRNSLNLRPTGCDVLPPFAAPPSSPQPVATPASPSNAGASSDRPPVAAATP